MGMTRDVRFDFASVCGDQQIEGDIFFETHAPVVQWSLIWILAMLSCTLGLIDGLS